MTLRFISGVQTALLFLVPALGLRADAPSPAGHWEGVLQTPNGELRLVLDVAKNDKGEWIGDMDLPDQGANDAPLMNIKSSGAAFSFQTGFPGEPVFAGTLSDDGKLLSGTAELRGDKLSFQLKRTGEPKVKLPPPSTPLGKEFEGAWEGVLDTGGERLRVVLHLARAIDGTGTGSLDSLDQNATGIAVSTVTQKGKDLELHVAIVNGSYKGKLDEAATAIAGDWTQNGATFPLSLKKKTEK